jgi:hypothetical protein
MRTGAAPPASRPPCAGAHGFLLFVVAVLLPADIQPGQGLYYLTTLNTWRAVNCDKNNYVG